MTKVQSTINLVLKVVAIGMAIPSIIICGTGCSLAGNQRDVAIDWASCPSPRLSFGE